MTRRDVYQFLEDLGLPSLDPDRLEEEMVKANSSSIGFTNLEDFFEFIVNQLIYVTDKGAYCSS